MSFTKPSVKLGTPRMGGDLRHTDTMEFLSPGVLIGFKAQAGGGYPTQQMKDKVNAAAIQARNIVRIANDKLASVILLRTAESQLMIDTFAKHYNLVAGDTAGGFLTDNTINRPFALNRVFEHDRRWVINKIREMTLSLSAHLNTGVYLIDQDKANRQVIDGAVKGAQHAHYDNWVGYVHVRAGRDAICGFKNGEIHVDFTSMDGYSLNTNACIIIHEAAHKYLGIMGDVYGCDPTYPPGLQLAGGSLENCDSLAWTAISLATGAVRMQDYDGPDFENCPGGAL
ncbi:MAG TPA: hypothetical protein VGM82_00405 [Gemmatimonadaceae bacterium]|jgi:hypothetical protein